MNRELRDSDETAGGSTPAGAIPWQRASPAVAGREGARLAAGAGDPGPLGPGPRAERVSPGRGPEGRARFRARCPSPLRCTRAAPRPGRARARTSKSSQGVNTTMPRYDRVVSASCPRLQVISESYPSLIGRVVSGSRLPSRFGRGRAEGAGPRTTARERCVCRGEDMEH